MVFAGNGIGFHNTYVNQDASANKLALYDAGYQTLDSMVVGAEDLVVHSIQMV